MHFLKKTAFRKCTQDIAHFLINISILVYFFDMTSLTFMLSIVVTSYLTLSFLKISPKSLAIASLCTIHMFSGYFLSFRAVFVKNIIIQILKVKFLWTMKSGFQLEVLNF